MQPEHNTEPQPLTVAKLRTYKGWENATDEAARRAVSMITQLAALVIEFLNYQETNDSTDGNSTFSICP